MWWWRFQIGGGGLGGFELRSLDGLGGRKESILSIYVPISFAEVCGVSIDIQYPIYTEVTAGDVYYLYLSRVPAILLFKNVVENISILRFVACEVAIELRKKILMCHNIGYWD